MIIVGASLLFGSLKTQTQKEGKAYDRHNSDTWTQKPSPRKSPFFYLNPAKYKDEKFVTWYDVLNNSLSPHRNNY